MAKPMLGVITQHLPDLTKQRIKICDEEQRQRHSQCRDPKALGRSDNFRGLPKIYHSWDHSLSNQDCVFQRDANFGNLQLMTKKGHDFFNHVLVKKNILVYTCAYVAFGFSVVLCVLGW